MTRARVDRIARNWAIAALVAWAFLLAAAVGSTADAAPADAPSVDVAPTSETAIEQRRDSPQTSVDEVARTVMCPTCDSTLDQSDSPAAQQMRAWIDEAVDAGWTDDEIRAGLVSEYGGDESILAVPRTTGVGIGAWLAPLVILITIVIAALVVPRRWRQTRSGSSSSSQASASVSSSIGNSSSSEPAPPSPPVSSSSR